MCAHEIKQYYATQTHRLNFVHRYYLLENIQDSIIKH